MKERKEPYFGRLPPSVVAPDDIPKEEYIITRDSLDTPVTYSHEESKLPRVNIGIYIISIYLILGGGLLLGQYGNGMWEISKQDAIRLIDLSGSSVTFFQGAILAKFMVAIIFITLAFFRVRHFRLIASLLILFGAIIVTVLEISVSILDPNLKPLLGAFAETFAVEWSTSDAGKINTHLVIPMALLSAFVTKIFFSLIVVLYLMVSKKVKYVFG
jgi:hypothetical protein